MPTKCIIYAKKALNWYKIRNREPEGQLVGNTAVVLPRYEGSLWGECTLKDDSVVYTEERSISMTKSL